MRIIEFQNKEGNQTSKLLEEADDLIM